MKSVQQVEGIIFFGNLKISIKDKHNLIAMIVSFLGVNWSEEKQKMNCF
jgi:hypothetical protein